MRLAPGRYCACGCSTPLDDAPRIARGLQPLRADAKWAGHEHAEAWRRRNPGRSKRDAQIVVVARTKPARRSGISVRIAARKAIDVLADELTTAGYPPADARARANARIRPLVSPRHQELLDHGH